MGHPPSAGRRSRCDGSGVSDPDGRELLAVALAAANAAAGVLVSHARQAVPTGVTTKSTPTDLVSAADLAAEAAIREVLQRERPDDAILGEEGEDQPGTSGLRWIVDPLDGTTNFLFGIDQWCVSIACEGRVGVILDPVRGECFQVVDGGTPTVDDAPLVPSSREDLATALVATGFGYDAQVRRAQAAQVADLLPRVRDIRRLGSAALDLAWTAAGRYDAYYERGPQIWDLAAGLLICDAAGLQTRTLPARDGMPDGVLVAPAGLIDALAALLV